MHKFCGACALAMAFASCGGRASGQAEAADSIAAQVVVGAERPDAYIDILDGKRVALFSNHTGLVKTDTAGYAHTLDLLLGLGVDVRVIFSPEHGFRGTADAGEAVTSSVDPGTGLPIVSLYGKGHAQAMEQALDSIDVVVSDIQDVGLRFYTYYCTMLELMRAASHRDQEFVVLDRPNPNGMYVDGPILDMKLASGVGRLPIPVVHGLTLGEMAQMACGEGWLGEEAPARLHVVPCENYGHQDRYELPVPPSPNLPNMKSIYLYPSLCYFEGTPVSLGRGTDKPFQIYGHPAMEGREFDFTPESRPGAANPPQLGSLCHGVDLSGVPDDEIIAKGLNLEYLIDAYRDVCDGKPGSLGPDEFFRSFFELLIGRDDIRQMIIDGKSADEIKATWAGDVEQFKELRKKYLLYSE